MIKININEKKVAIGIVILSVILGFMFGDIVNEKIKRGYYDCNSIYTSQSQKDDTINNDISSDKHVQYIKEDEKDYINQDKYFIVNARNFNLNIVELELKSEVNNDNGNNNNKREILTSLTSQCECDYKGKDKYSKSDYELDETLTDSIHVMYDSSEEYFDKLTDVISKDTGYIWLAKGKNEKVKTVCIDQMESLKGLKVSTIETMYVVDSYYNLLDLYLYVIDSIDNEDVVEYEICIQAVKEQKEYYHSAREKFYQELSYKRKHS